MLMTMMVKTLTHKIKIYTHIFFLHNYQNFFLFIYIIISFFNSCAEVDKIDLEEEEVLLSFV